MIRYIFKSQNYNTIYFQFKKYNFNSTNFFKEIKYYYSSKKNEEQKEKLSKEANERDYLWNILAFDRNISFFSISFYILLVATLSLHFYNNMNENNKLNKVNEAIEREKKILTELQNKRKNS
ncbi:conserved protein, unknown function [Plasmodium gallinaceum]|uniref:Uncharacterized protein n=1 Tax=Plasmodium gallinaceum TaxID=5849 RepID=A0A1J1GPG4_PLAGA|nr:conserved protein, unknown function [Plasmodium gallinaceum]CRG94393.1 conserved protein, unknown function [Plasmodium gallinaceum]